jgi:hypothetical protein
VLEKLGAIRAGTCESVLDDRKNPRPDLSSLRPVHADVFAGRLETGNVVEYEDAAQFAKELDFAELRQRSSGFGRVELEHEVFFARWSAAIDFYPP